MTCKYTEVLSSFHAWWTWRREQLSDSSMDTGKPAAGYGSPRYASVLPRPAGHRGGLILLPRLGAAAGVRARGRSHSAAGRRRWRGPGGPARHGGGRAGSPRRGGVGAVPGQRAEPPLPEPFRASEAAVRLGSAAAAGREGGRRAPPAPCRWVCFCSSGRVRPPPGQVRDGTGPRGRLPGERGRSPAGGNFAGGRGPGPSSVGCGGEHWARPLRARWGGRGKVSGQRLRLAGPWAEREGRAAPAAPCPELSAVEPVGAVVLFPGAARPSACSRRRRRLCSLPLPRAPPCTGGSSPGGCFFAGVRRCSRGNFPVQLAEVRRKRCFRIVFSVFPLKFIGFERWYVE